MEEGPPQEEPGIVSRLEQGKRLWELGVWMVAVGTAVTTFIRSIGGPVQFLVEVGTFGFACYVAVFLVLPAVVGGIVGLEKLTGRETTDTATGIILGLGLLGGGALIRFGLFHPTVTQDLDAIGTAFSSLVGVVILCIPLALLWYFHGSRVNN